MQRTENPSIWVRVLDQPPHGAVSLMVKRQVVTLKDVGSSPTLPTKYYLYESIIMNNKIFLTCNEDTAQKIGEFIYQQFAVDGNTHVRSGIILPAYDVNGKLYSISVGIRDATEDERAFPLFLDENTAANM